jgi:hypothetical protein
MVYLESFRNFFESKSEEILLESNSSGEVLTHLTHLEELILASRAEQQQDANGNIFYKKVFLKKNGFNQALDFLKNVYDNLRGNANSPTFVTIKFDGAPSLICGFHPETNKFFVSTKSIANVTPKVNFTDEDIEKNHGHAPGLTKKLKIALKYLPSVINPGAIYQGDFLYDKDDLFSQNINGEELITFKPNTITYAVDKNSLLGKKVLRSNMGIIFHTKYTGPTLQNLMRSSNVDISEFNVSSNVLVDDAKFKDVSGTATFTKQETQEMSELVDRCVSVEKKIKWDSVLDQVYEFMNTFINSLIRTGKFVEDPVTEYDNFIEWLTNKSESSVEKMKTEKGKQKKRESFNEFLQKVEATKLSIINLFLLTKYLEQAKQLIIKKYNAAIKTKQFITNEDGTLQATAPEGYVAVDNSENMVKFVSRLDFSAANFAKSKEEKFK